MKIFQLTAAFALLLLLSGCQAASQQSQASDSSKNVPAKSSSTQAASQPQTETTTQSEEDQSMSYSAGSLIQAVTANNLDQTKAILSSANYPLDEVNEHGETPLLIAVHNNQVDIAKALIDAGADINKQDAIQDSPYLYAGAQGRSEILSYMLAHATPNQAITNRFGGNALIPAAEKGHLDNVKILLADKRVDINHQNNYGYTALIEAVALRDGSQVYQDIVAELLKNGADPTLVDNYGKTALDYANQLGYGNMAKMLQEAQR
ncbi:ankyrin repeat domain-containing protein [Enterococcus pallens]|uniref:Ankyrin repeat-containing protein n=1 Tax=Enterococcus pallens ATCC BAA-351 TaxID=1158607 RepID=R2SFW7_9ENTE|nr:ankyrin repeat domain-containing protein [Enterococcus pallens]EOH94245.1 ankyrin repeat-containing protein [Enterococcus pallens ATCC BAA-351]EOU24124.1 ankyrin repeat-containing protein [Enterococcus pallens ATCC BAA-351]OJG82105.1 ankyrin repeat-containing protein [Enterococcus pallens]